MATRRKTPNFPGKRSGLRSKKTEKMAAAAINEGQEEEAWATENEDYFTEDGDLAQSAEVGASAKPETELLSIMRSFLEGQQRREQSMLAELRGLRASMPQQVPARVEPPQPSGRPVAEPEATTSSAWPPPSPNVSLPTPLPRQRPPLAMQIPMSSGGSVYDPPRPDARFYADPKIPQYQTGEDIENYLLRFERIAKTWVWPENEWACRLVPLLSGKALEAYSAMDEERAHSYPHLKEALLAKFDISPETHRQQFRSTVVPSGENPTETYHRLKGLYRRWIRPEERTKEEIGETIILEQFLRVLPVEIRTWVKEHEPTDGLTAAKLAQQYLNARRGPLGPFSTSATRRPAPPSRSIRRETLQECPGNASPAPGHPGTGKELICFYCQQPGHKASLCPIRKAKLSGACYVPRPEEHRHMLNTKKYKSVAINGETVNALLDSGSSRSLVRQDLVPVSSMDYNQSEDILCVHGDKHIYPTADVTVDIDGQTYLLTVGVVANLPVPALFGWDLPILLDLLLGNDHGDVDVTCACPVLTRAQAKASAQTHPDLVSGLDVDGTQVQVDEGTNELPFANLNDGLFEGGTKGPRKSRRQRRYEKQMGAKVPNKEKGSVKDMWEVPGNISELQKNDCTLKHLFAKVGGPSRFTEGKACFVMDQNVLYIIENGVKRLVVPESCRSLVMYLGHTLPWAGHLGRNKTYMRISARFYWPSMYSDIQNYCSTCPVCQQSCAVRKSDRALLHPLPVISTPFRRVAMDIVGPLVKSSSGCQYILVLSDYATRFPEAFPLRTITAPVVLRALVQFFSRVGIPDEILTDQGTNFTSRLMHLFNQQLGISAIKTTPYHPQTDGLVERFNQTLKKMLQKFVTDTGKDWDRWLPFVLFAYREVPQASTGFSPFELLYGWDVQGPLDLLRKEWEAPSTKPNDRNIVQYVLEMRDRLSRYQEEAALNLRQAQQSQKTWYDQQARQREFQPGQKVLLLLPSSTCKLLAKWQGPYTIVRKMGPVTYEVLHPEKKRTKQTYHVNLLKEWKERTAAVTPSSLLVQQVDVPENEEGEDGVEGLPTAAEPVVAHLTSEQVDQLLSVFKEVPSLFAARPGKTAVVEHVIRLKDVNPIRQRSYRVPQHLGEKLKQEVEEMLKLGVIEPSNSEYCSPVVIVLKKDGSLRICIDFRKINAVSEFDAYPMPRIDELLERIGRAQYITTLDLCKGYWQVPLEKSCRPYTAFQTPRGLFQFTVMPFGLHGAPATFQRLMDQVLRGCAHCSAAYLDDVVVYSNTWEDHIQHLTLVLGKIQKAGLTLNPSKCEWAKEETRYLGYRLGHGEVRPQIDKVEAVKNCPRPRTKKEVRSFLGLAGWYRRFVPQFASIAAPLTALTGKDQKNPVVWSEACEIAFQTLKDCLCSSPVLKSPDFSRRFLVQVDASAVGLGAVLAQGDLQDEQPVLFLSRKLLPRETRYSTVEKEGLAIKWALESLKYYLLGREFDLETDHRALTWINTMKDQNSRLTRWYLSLQPFKFVIRHRAGKSNVVADFLSRLPHIANLPEEGDNVTVRTLSPRH